MGKKWDKFALLMWKNCVLQYRKPVQTIMEIAAPVLFSVLLVIIRSLVAPTEYANLHYDPFCPIFLCNMSDEIAANLKPKAVNWAEQIKDIGNFGSAAKLAKIGSDVLYYPDDENIRSVMMWFNVTYTIIKMFNETAKVIGFNSTKDMESYYVNNSLDTLAAVEFRNHPTSLTGDIQVAIRFPSELRAVLGMMGPTNWKTNLLFPLYETPGPRNFNSTEGGDPNYFLERFLLLQYFVTQSVIFHKRYPLSWSKCEKLKKRDPHDVTTFGLDILFTLKKGENMINVYMRRFSHAKWTSDSILEALQTIIGMLVLLSFVYTGLNTIKVITNEKEKQLKEVMKIIGLPNWLHWTAWFVKTFSYLIISIILIIILLKIPWYPKTNYSIFTKSDPTVLFVFFLFYICSIITFSFAISVFFSKANTAATVGSFLWFIAYVPYFVMQQNYDTLTLAEKLGASIGMNCAMSFGLQLVLMFEGGGEGIQWHNIFRPASPDDNLVLGHIFMILTIDSFIYLIIALYVEQVFPGEYGVPKPWYFLCSFDYWLGCRKRKIPKDREDYKIRSLENEEFFEKEPKDLTPGIRISHLRKVFKKHAAVKDLSLNMYENQITVLLGHNGAGKTTTMHMLTGMIPPTSGTAWINDYDIRVDMEKVRSSLGLCPQHNVLFDEMTVYEHLYFCCKLRGMDKRESKIEAEKYIDLLELQPKAHCRSSTLSGGMKRKLSVGMALCGNSKVVMLDEPTAGMDPSARRALWEFLQSQKHGRTILLTTHYMDEADLLGDRIAIMSGGVLQCCGSSFFLKKKYGAGYHLIMEKDENCNPDYVTRLLRKYVPRIEIHSNVGAELSYLLDQSYASLFEQLLSEIESDSEYLGIRSYGISLTTLEEVFMKVGAEHDQTRHRFLDLISLGGGSIYSTVEYRDPDDVPPNLEGCSLVCNQYLAMFMKRMLSTWRSWLLQILTILLPVVYLIFVIMMKRAYASQELPTLVLSVSLYTNTVVLLELHNDTTNIANYYYKDVVSQTDVRVVDSIANFMINQTKKKPTEARRKYLFGATIAENSTTHNITAWFNNDAYHASPVAYSLALNSILKKELEDQDIGITFIHDPLPYMLTSKFSDLQGANSMGIQLAFNMGFSMTTVSAFYVLFYVKERSSKSKHLQFVCGMNAFIYWTTSFICDIITYVFSPLALIITFAIFQEDGYSTAEELTRIFFILSYYGFAVLPLVYVLSFLFSIPATGYTSICLFGTIAGDMLFLIIHLMQILAPNAKKVGDILHWIFLVFPYYNLCTSIRDSFNTYSYDKLCNHACNASGFPHNCSDIICTAFPDFCCGERGDYYKWESPGLGPNILYAFTFGTVVFSLLILHDSKCLDFLIYFLFERKKKKGVPVLDEDNDVAKERYNIRNTPLDELTRKNVVVLRDVTKYYGSFLAVNELCLGVKRSECFGLLGLNGAGKTTTFKILTGDIRMTNGEAWVEGYSINNELKKVQKLIGYCPQFDALLDDLTARETIIMFGLIRGIRLTEIVTVAKQLSEDFDFRKHLDKQIKKMSGGNKRKVSAALSLVGNPPVVYLDEPTAGMDVATKRYLWDVLCDIRDFGKCIILTSHSMEECEALCTRLAIMVNGILKCLGSTQHLKTKFTEGYTLTVKLKKADEEPSQDDIDEIKLFVEEKFGHCQLREQHQELLTYYILDTHLPWSKMFGILEEGKDELNIEDYSLAQSSLEQVFLTFTRLQRTASFN